MATNDQISTTTATEQVHASHADDAAELDRVINGPRQLANPRRTTLAHVGARQH